LSSRTKPLQFAKRETTLRKAKFFLGRMEEIARRLRTPIKGCRLAAAGEERTMKTRSMLIGVAMVAMLNGAAVNAQVLGGVGGSLGGGLSGGLRDMSMTSQGAMNGTLGADLDSGTLRRSTRDTTDRVTDRARNTTSTVRDRATSKVDRTREKVGETREVATATTSSAAASAVSAVKDVQIDGAADMAGSATSNVSRDGVDLAGVGQGAGNGTVSGAAAPKTEAPNMTPAKLAGSDAANVSNATRGVAEHRNAEPAVQPSKENSTSGLLGANSAAGGSGSSNASGGLVDAPKATESEPAQQARGVNLASDANGSASASRSGVEADGRGSMSASRK
jgi:hypothetical protein